MPYLLDFGGLDIVVSEAFNCCSISAILVVASVMTVAGLLLGQNLLLTAGAGAIILILLLLRLLFVLPKHLQQSMQREDGTG